MDTSKISSALEEVAPWEGGRIINDHYSLEDYVKRRGYFFGQHSEYRHRATGLFDLARTHASEIFDTEHQKLSVQEVRRREIKHEVIPLLPLPTDQNTDSLDNFAGYPATEWTEDPPLPGFSATQQLSDAGVEVLPSEEVPRPALPATKQLSDAGLEDLPSTLGRSDGLLNSGAIESEPFNDATAQSSDSDRRVSSDSSSSEATKSSQTSTSTHPSSMSTADFWRYSQAMSKLEGGPPLPAAFQELISEIVDEEEQSAHLTQTATEPKQAMDIDPRAFPMPTATVESNAAPQPGLFAGYMANAPPLRDWVKPNPYLDPRAPDSKPQSDSEVEMQDDLGGDRNHRQPPKKAKKKANLATVHKGISSLSGHGIHVPVKGRRGTKRSATPDTDASEQEGFSGTQDADGRRKKKLKTTQDSAEPALAVKKGTKRRAPLDTIDEESDEDTIDVAHPAKRAKIEKALAELADFNALPQARPRLIVKLKLPKAKLAIAIAGHLPAAPQKASRPASKKTPRSAPPKKAAQQGSNDMAQPGTGIPSGKTLPPPAIKRNKKAPTLPKPSVFEQVISGTTLPRSPGDARTAADVRYNRLLEEYKDNQRSQLASRSQRARKVLDEEQPDIMPEFFRPENFEKGMEKESVRCVCGAVENDKKAMVGCEDCSVWQHVACMGDAVPEDLKGEEDYFCHVCDPWSHRELIAQLRRDSPYVG